MNKIRKFLDIKNSSGLISVILHIIFLILIINSLNFNQQPEKYIEVGFGVPGGGSGGASPNAGNNIIQSPVAAISPDIPNTEEKTSAKADETIKKDIKPTDDENKSESYSNSIGTENSKPENNNSTVTGKGGTGANPEGTGVGNGWGNGSGNGNGNGNGEGNGVGDGYSIDFGGRIRKIYSYIIPDYPDGVSKQADVRLRFNIMADGTVGRISTLTKVDGKLENAAINSLRLWRFEPLSPGQNQVEQTVIITFPFRLQ
jgi:TonB family protein